MQLHYDKVTEAVYLQIHDRPIVESEEVHPGIVLDFDDQGTVVAIEVYRSGKGEVPGPEGVESRAAETSAPNGRISELGMSLLAIRKRIEDAGLANLSWDDIEREVGDRRGDRDRWMSR